MKRMGWGVALWCSVVWAGCAGGDEPAAGADLSDFGAPCLTGDECAGMECVRVISGQAPICTMSCDGFVACPTGSTCVQTFDGPYCAPAGLDSNNGADPNNGTNNGFDPNNGANNGANNGTNNGTNNGDPNNGANNGTNNGANNGDSNNGVDPDACGPDGDCAPGSYCELGRCVEGCRVDAHCPSGERCVESACVEDEEPPACTDAAEPNNALAAATPLEGAPADLRICPGDIDIFWFETTAPNAAVSVDVLFSHVEGDLNAELLDANGDIMLRALGQTDNERLQRTLPAGRWYVRVQGASAQVTAAYRLQANIGDGEVDPPVDPPVGDCEDDYEPNDSASAAAAIQPGGLSAVMCEDEDWYAVTAAAGQVITARVTFDGEISDIDLQLRAPNGTTTLDSSTLVLNSEEVSATAATAGTYYVRVYAIGDDLNPYQMTITVEDGEVDPPVDPPVDDCEDDYEPNNSASAAAALSPGATDAVMCGDDDWYAITLEAWQTVTARITFDDDISDVEMQLRAPNGTTSLDSSLSTSDVEEVSAQVNAAGTYYLRVYAIGRDPNPYAMTVTVEDGEPPVDPCADDYEPNNNAAGAIAARPGALEAVMCGDEDWYAVTLEAGQIITARATFDDDISDVEMQLRAPNGTTSLDSSLSSTDVEEVSATATTAGTYYVRLYAIGSTPNPYAMTITVEDGEPPVDPPVGECQDEYEVNNTWQTAAPLQPGTFQATLCSGDDDNDWYAVTLEAGDTVTASISFTHALSDIDLRLIGTNGTSELDRSLSYTNAEEVSATVTTPGTYFLRVNTLSGRPNPYTLTLEVEGAPEVVACEDRFEANDDVFTATFLTPGRYEALDACFGSDREDWYELDLVAGQDMRFRLLFSHAEGDLDLFLVSGEDGDTILDSSETSTDNEEIFGAAGFSDTFYLVVISYSGARTPYVLEIIEE